MVELKRGGFVQKENVKKIVYAISMFEFVTVLCLNRNFLASASGISLCMYICITQRVVDASIHCVLRLVLQVILEPAGVQSAHGKPFILYCSEFSRILNNLKLSPSTISTVHQKDSIICEMRNLANFALCSTTKIKWVFVLANILLNLTVHVKHLVW